MLLRVCCLLFFFVFFLAVTMIQMKFAPEIFVFNFCGPTAYLSCALDYLVLFRMRDYTM